MLTQSGRKPSQSTPSILYPQITSSKASARLGCSMYFCRYLQGNDTGKLPRNLPSPASPLSHAHKDRAGPYCWTLKHALREGWPNSDLLGASGATCYMERPRRGGKVRCFSCACTTISESWGVRHHHHLHLTLLCFQGG